MDCRERFRVDDRRQRSLPGLDRVERDDAGDRDDMENEHDEQRPRQLHVRLGHLFVVHLVGTASERRAVVARSFLRLKKLGYFHGFIWAGRGRGHGIDRRGRRSF